MKTLIVILVVIALGAIIYFVTKKKPSKNLPGNNGQNGGNSAGRKPKQPQNLR